MTRRRRVRSKNVDLLVRPPAGGWPGSTGARFVADPVEQLRELARLVEDGLLSMEEFERQRRKVLEG